MFREDEEGGITPHFEEVEVAVIRKNPFEEWVEGYVGKVGRFAADQGKGCFDVGGERRGIFGEGDEARADGWEEELFLVGDEVDNDAWFGLL